MNMCSISKPLLINLIAIMLGTCISNTASATGTYGNAEQTSTNTLIDLSLEELMDFEITTVSKRPQRISGGCRVIQLRACFCKAMSIFQSS